MGSEFKEAEKELAQINKQRKEAEKKLKSIINLTIMEVVKECPVKRIGPKMISVKFSELIDNPWNMQYHDWIEASKMVTEYLSKIDVSEWREKLVDLLAGDTESRKPVILKKRQGGCLYQIPVNRKFIVKIIEKL